MPADSLKAQVQPVAQQAFKATFLGYDDPNNIATLFAQTFAPKFATAVATYLTLCVGLPPGGPIQAGQTQQLEQDIANAGKEAFKATFIGYEDRHDIATKFGNELKPIAAAIASWVPQNMTIPAAPPAIPVSPGGPVIASPSASVVPVCFKCGKKAFEATFIDQDGSAKGAGWDSMNIATIFATTFQNIGNFIGIYMQTVTSLPGGGPLQAR